MKALFFLLPIWVAAANLLSAQTAVYDTQYGTKFPPSMPAGTAYVRALVVFAEIDYDDVSWSDCKNGTVRRTDPYPNAWKPGAEYGNIADANGSINANGDAYFRKLFEVNPPSSNTFNPEQLPQGLISAAYYAASFGKLYLIADYIPEVIKVPCINVFEDNTAVFKAVKKRFPNLVPTRYNGNLTDSSFDTFDKVTGGANYVPKTSGSDGWIDAVFVFWKNTEGFTDASLGGWTTSDMDLNINDTFPLNKVRVIANGVAPHIPNGSAHLTRTMAHELMHQIQGSNTWHVGHGRTQNGYARMLKSSAYGLLASSGSTFEITTSAWERWLLGWKHPDKTHLISAINPSSSTEVNTDIGYGQSGTFRIRNVFTTGDAIRIALPFINDNINDNFSAPKYDPLVLNQYLWLEYRKPGLSHTYGVLEEYSDGGVCEQDYSALYPYGTPGVYVYHQIGKDVKTANSVDLLSGLDVNSHNRYSNHIHSVPAAGCFDYNYFSRECGTVPGDQCWCGLGGTGVKTVFNEDSPTPHRPNPLTGFSYHYNSGVSDDLIGGVLKLKTYSLGSRHDPFGTLNNKTLMTNFTNPACTPVETYEKSKGDFLNTSTRRANRIIHLNGLKIEIVNENTEEGYADVRISWDHYTLDEDVRWCGNIMLHGPFIGEQIIPVLHIPSGKTLLLDRGLSKSLRTPKSDGIYSEPTTLTVRSGAGVTVDGTLELKNKSTLVIEDGAVLRVQNGGKVVIHEGCTLALRGAMYVYGDGRLDVMSKGVLRYFPTSRLGLSDPFSALNVYGNRLLSSFQLDQGMIALEEGTEENPCVFSLAPAPGDATPESGIIRFFGTGPTSHFAPFVGDWRRSRIELSGSGHSDLTLAANCDVSFLVPVAFTDMRVSIAVGKSVSFNPSNASGPHRVNFTRTTFTVGDAGRYKAVRLYAPAKIEECIFSRGEKGVSYTPADANLTSPYRKLEILWSEFRYCGTGAYSEKGGALLESSQFLQCGIGWEGKQLSHQCEVKFCIFEYENLQSWGCRTQSNAAAKVRFDGNVFSCGTGAALQGTVGIFDCNVFNFPYPNTIGVVASTFSELVMGKSPHTSLTSVPNYNAFLGEGLPVALEYANDIFLDCGRNCFAGASSPLFDSQKVYGLLSASVSSPKQAKFNDWGSGPVSASDYWVATATGGTIAFEDGGNFHVCSNPFSCTSPSPSQYTSVSGGGVPPWTPVCACPMLNTQNYLGVPSHVATESVEMEIREKRTRISRYHEILKAAGLFAADPTANFVSRVAYTRMLHDLHAGFEEGELAAGDVAVGWVLEIQDSVLARVPTDSSEYFFRLCVGLNKAQVLRLNLDYTGALRALTDLEPQTAGADKHLVQSFYCHLSNERDLNADEDETDYAPCSFEVRAGFSTTRRTVPGISRSVTGARYARETERPQRGTVSIYPNPAKNSAEVCVPENATLSIYNSFGKQEEEFKLSAGTNVVELSRFASGVYFCVVVCESGEVFSQKLVVAR